MRRLLILAAVCALGGSAHAQSGYSFSVGGKDVQVPSGCADISCVSVREPSEAPRRHHGEAMRRDADETGTRSSVRSRRAARSETRSKVTRSASERHHSARVSAARASTVKTAKSAKPAARREMARPEVAKPQIAKPEIAKPEIAKPSLLHESPLHAAPVAMAPEKAPETKTPEAKTVGTIAPAPKPMTDQRVTPAAATAGKTMTPTTGTRPAQAVATGQTTGEKKPELQPNRPR